jgi:hypothetical protein
MVVFIGGPLQKNLQAVLEAGPPRVLKWFLVSHFSIPRYRSLRAPSSLPFDVISKPPVMSIRHQIRKD